MPEESSKASITIPKPHCGPEDPLGQKAISLGEAIIQLSGQISSVCNNEKSPDFPNLSQFILKRGQLLGELTALNVRQLSSPVQNWLKACLEYCQSIDSENLPRMQQIHTGWEKQLKSLKDASTLMNKYRAGSAEDAMTRSEQA